MKKNSYIILALAGMLSMNSCNDDEFLPGNPSMEIKAENADALFGDSLPFTIKASDVDVPLSTLKAQLFYGEEQVSETVIRTKTSGNDYTGKIFVPYYANIPNGKATLKYILQNIHFTTTEMTKELALARPDFPYLTLVDEEGKEYRMERQSMYKYSVTGDFSQKMKAYIKTPKVGENGNELTFGWENGTIEAGSTNAISFSNTEPGNYAIKFNTLTYEAEPFAKLKVNGEDMELVENDIYAIKLTLKKNDILAFEGDKNDGYEYHQYKSAYILFLLSVSEMMYHNSNCLKQQSHRRSKEIKNFQTGFSIQPKVYTHIPYSFPAIDRTSVTKS